MSGRLAIIDLRIDCIIGCLPDERIREQPLFVDLEIELDVTEAATSDSLDSGIDYVQLADRAREIAQSGRFRLIEAYAHAVLDALELPAVRWARVRVKKPGAIPSARYAQVEMERAYCLVGVP